MVFPPAKVLPAELVVHAEYLWIFLGHPRGPRTGGRGQNHMDAAFPQPVYHRVQPGKVILALLRLEVYKRQDLDYAMFCYQCEQTANGKGCTKQGVCGKTPEIANLQDLLIFQIKGISCYGKALLDKGKPLDKAVIRFIENALFTTLTNVNFDADVHVKLLQESQRIKEQLRSAAGAPPTATAHATYDLPKTKTEMLRDAPLAGILYDKALDPDIRSLRQTIVYGLKGISAYGHQARELGYASDCLFYTSRCV